MTREDCEKCGEKTHHYVTKETHNYICGECGAVKYRLDQPLVKIEISPAQMAQRREPVNRGIRERIEIDTGRSLKLI
ncbi:hypothetical protein HY212_07670 [Candidatus Pacearchaeota archaeon]|nr:hypothetical protein [Candidatus Pacearchaeota archaeon]